MRERPILFASSMVRAIIAGTKTQTRRPVGERGFAATWLRHLDADDDVRGACAYVADPANYPPYVAGNRLWVRETWAHDAGSLDALRAEVESVDGACFGHGPYYRADMIHEGSGLRWRSSIHMPRWASRLSLEVTRVRVQRLQKITDADAIAEGMPHASLHNLDCASTPPTHYFRKAWDALYGKTAPWASSPWVWAISFQRVTP